MLAHAQRPLIIAGRGCLIAGATPELRELVDKAQVPVITTLLGKSALPESHALCLGMAGMHGESSTNRTVQQADLILAVGTRFTDRLTGTNANSFAPDAKIIHVDVDPAEIGKRVRVDLPIVGDAGPIGWIEAETALALDGEQRRTATGLLRIYANHLAVLDYGEHDTLTGLRNRKTFDAMFLKRLAELRVAQGEPHWIGVIDIDHFKRINDRYGHLFGDEVLMLIARILRSAFPPGDILYRFGGEEFVVQMSATPFEEAWSVFDGLRQRVADYCFPQVGQVTVSVGFTAIERNDTPSSAFDRADEALYEAKKQGRNRCVASRVDDAGRPSSGPRVQGEVLLF